MKDYIFVTLKMPTQPAIDLKIPSFVTGRELLSMVSEMFRMAIPQSAKIQAEPIGRILDPDQTLASEGADDGSLLTLL